MRKVIINNKPNKYRVYLQRRGENHPAHKVVVEAYSEYMAIRKAKKFVAENELIWPIDMPIFDREGMFSKILVDVLKEQ